MFIVELPEPVIDDGLKLTDTPLGTPDADNAMGEPSVPPLTVLLMVELPDAPWPIDTDEGEAESVKLAVGPVTVNDTVVVWVTLPPVPVTVMLYVPVAVEDPTVMFMVALPDPPVIVDDGLKPIVTPEGAPEADRATSELNPPTTVLVIVELPAPPCATETLAGEAARLKLGVAAVPASAFSRPVPLGLPQPVARS